MKISKALSLSFLWAVLALVFDAGIYAQQGPQKAVDFLAGYLIELSLSIDNIFIFLLVFTHFKVSPRQQSPILFWGVVGAQLMRAVFIVTGIGLLNSFHWVIYVFGAFLAFTGFKVLTQKDKELSPEDNGVLKWCRRVFPNLNQFWMVLIVIEAMDLIFALDSVPAVLAITKDPFIVYTSNIFAVLGLRAMYFVLAGVMPKFHLLHYALGAILVFVGLKMLLQHYLPVPTVLALGFVVLALASSIILSLIFPKKVG